MTDELSTYTIYDHPRDYPDSWVVRRWQVVGAGPVDAGVVALAPTLEEARQAVPPGLVCLERSQDDDLTIVETWI